MGLQTPEHLQPRPHAAVGAVVGLSVSVPDGPATVGGARVYVYDASGQRVAQVQVSELTTEASPVAASVYVGDVQVDDADAAVPGGVTGTRFVTFGGATVATVTVTNGGEPDWALLFGDVQGSAQVVMGLNVDPASATGFGAASVTESIQRTAHTPYGARRGTEDLDIDRGWLGQVEDTDTGLTYLNARYYDPVLSRFLSPDPLMDPGDPRTLDAYRYAENNPVAYTDASGLRSMCTTSGGRAEMDCMGRESNAGVDYHTGSTKVVNSRAKVRSGRYGGNTGPGDGSASRWDPASGPLFVSTGVVSYDDTFSFDHEASTGTTLVTSTVDCGSDVHAGFGQVNDYCVGLLKQRAIRDLRERDGWFNRSLAWYGDHSDAITATIAVAGVAGGSYSLGKSRAATTSVERVPNPEPQHLPNGSPNRGPAAWVNTRDKSGNVVTHSSSPGVHAEIAAQRAVPGAQMSEVWGWRGPTSAPVWQNIPICPRCQAQLPQSLFPPGVPADDGPWGAS